MTQSRFSRELVEFVQAIKPGTAASIPWAKITKLDFHNLFASSAMDYAMQLMNHASDRDLAIGAYGQLEYLLALILKAFVVEEAGEKLFGNGEQEGKIKGEVSIDLAFALGLITRIEKEQLHIFRKIRNRFSHDYKLERFQLDPRVMGFCNSLKLKFDNAPSIDLSPRMRFSMVIVQLTSILERRSNEASSRLSERKPSIGNTKVLWQFQSIIPPV